MDTLPVVKRELRVAARRRETWRLRLAYATGATVALAFGVFLPEITPRDRGIVVLICLSVCAFVLNLFAGAYLTADSISSEKREGTLGLLFLTPLNGFQIVLGKMATHSLQVGYALVGSFPIFFLPILMGGVVWAEVTRVGLVMLATLLLSLSVGLFWSTKAVEARTTVMASAVSMILLTLLPWLWPFIRDMLPGGSFELTGLAQISPMTQLIFAFESNYEMGGRTLTGRYSGAFIYWGSLLFSLGLSLALLVLSSWMIPRVWRRSEAGGRSTRSARRSRPKILHHAPPVISPRRIQLLEAAPVQWLLERRLKESAWLRVMRWATVLFFAFMLMISLSTRHWKEGFISAMCAAYGLHLITRIQYALSGTGPGVEDRRSGALEALLATPLSDAELIHAHHGALKWSFRGPLLVLLAMNTALQLAVVFGYDHLHMGSGEWAIFSVWFIGGAVIALADFAALRWLCLCESLRSSTHLKAAGRAFLLLNAFAWPAFGVTFIAAVQFNQEEVAASIFVLWVVGCLISNRLLVSFCRGWLKTGLRQRVSNQ